MERPSPQHGAKTNENSDDNGTHTIMANKIIRHDKLQMMSESWYTQILNHLKQFTAVKELIYIYYFMLCFGSLAVLNTVLVSPLKFCP